MYSQDLNHNSNKEYIDNLPYETNYNNEKLSKYFKARLMRKNRNSSIYIIHKFPLSTRKFSYKLESKYIEDDDILYDDYYDFSDIGYMIENYEYMLDEYNLISENLKILKIIEKWFNSIDNLINYIEKGNVLYEYFQESLKYEIITYSILIDHFTNSNELSNIIKCLNYVYQNFLIFSYSLIKHNEETKLKLEIEKKISSLIDEPHLNKLIKDNNTNLLLELNKIVDKSKIKDLINNNINESREIVLSNLQKLVKILSEEQKVLDKTIQDIQIPYLPKSNKKYTIVLDLDETLIHYVEEENSAFVQVRPNTDIFLAELNKYYEIIIFTAAMSDYADLVLDKLDSDKKISHRLYRQHTLKEGNAYIKDISKLGRDLSKVIIIDNIEENYKLQKENGLNIKSFYGDEEDNELLEILFDLINIVKDEIDDVRIKLNFIRNKMMHRYKLI